jgi:hypothetical protein
METADGQHGRDVRQEDEMSWDRSSPSEVRLNTDVGGVDVTSIIS